MNPRDSQLYILEFNDSIIIISAIKIADLLAQGGEGGGTEGSSAHLM